MPQARSMVSLVPVMLLSAGVQAAPFEDLVILGDSLSDTGNLFIATGTPPLSDAFPEPVPQESAYYRGRFADGPVWIEYLHDALGFAGAPVPSLAGGSNYAIGGARSRYHRYDTARPDFDPLADESEFFDFSLLGQRDALLADAGGTLDPDALYSVWAGANDAFDAFAIEAAGDPDAAEALLRQSAADKASVIADLIDAGAETLLVPNVPDVSTVPFIAAMGPEAQARASRLSARLNELVADALAGRDATLIRPDMSGVFTGLAADPTLFGLPAEVITDEPCFTGFVGIPGEICENPERYAYWEVIHPSAVFHQVLGDVGIAAVRQASADAVPEPATLALLAGATAGLGWMRRRAGKGAA